MLRLAAFLLLLALESLVGLGIEQIVKLWLAVKPIKRLKARRKRKKMDSWIREHGGPPDEVLEEFNSDDKETSVLQGKLTYSAQVGMAIVFVGQLLGVEITEQAAASIVGVALALAGIYGRWRATKG